MKRKDKHSVKSVNVRKAAPAGHVLKSGDLGDIMKRYSAIIEFYPEETHEEKAMLEVEQIALSKTIPYIRNKSFKFVSVKTKCTSNYDVSYKTATCVISLEEA